MAPFQGMLNSKNHHYDIQLITILTIFGVGVGYWLRGWGGGGGGAIWRESVSVKIVMLHQNMQLGWSYIYRIT